MSTNPPALEYLLLFRNNAWYQDLAPDEIEESMNQFTAGVDKLSEEGKLKGAGPLESIGNTLTSANVMFDAPFAESKTAAAGYFVLQPRRLEEAGGKAKPVLQGARYHKVDSQMGVKKPINWRLLFDRSAEAALRQDGLSCANGEHLPAPELKRVTGNLACKSVSSRILCGRES